MPRIKILSEVVASQIAAGEVVQRPASAVKELVDNSLDAGAGRILIEVEKGGNALIRVVDDGCGISEEDLPMVLKRHATSKIELESDLRSIQTHGFRGEAMAAIASVSKTEIISRLQGEHRGYRLRSEGGTIVSVEPVGSPPGTSVTVSDLFFNTPARKKFMKSASTEMQRVGEVAVRAALAHPDIHFELSHNGRRSRHYPPVPSRADRLVQILGDKIVGELLAVDHANERIRIEGFVGRPTIHRKSASDIYLFVNGRFVRDRILLRSLAEAYRASLPQRRYPVAVLFVELPPDQVDVNVHPTKEEIRFSDEGMVWRALYSAVRDTLSGLSRTEWMPTESTETDAFDRSGETSREESADNFEKSRGTNVRRTTETFASRVAEHEPSGEEIAAPSSTETVESSPIPATLPEEPVSHPSEPGTAPSGEPVNRPIESTEDRIELMARLNRGPLNAAQTGGPEPSATVETVGNPWRVVAQVFKSFILCESRDEMALFDQHALHERLQFEKLRRQHETGRIDRQTLMFPLTLEVTSRKAEVLEEALPLFSDFGLEMEPFGDRTFVVRAIPADLDLSEVEGLVEDALHDLSEQGVVSPLGDRAEKILARMSCRSAIKANEPLDRDQMQHLIDQYSENPILSTCPHGRPPIWRLTRRELEKLFDRP